MNIQLSDHFTYCKLLRFTIPSIAMMIITSIYGVVDGLFVSNVVGAEAFAAVNLIMPFAMIFASISFMLSTGGSALVGKIIGEGNVEKGNQIFSMLVYLIIGIGIIFGIFGIVFLEPIAIMIGATEELLQYSIPYGTILFISLPFFMLQTTFQVFFVVAEKPHMGLIISIAAGLTNVFLDFLFIYFFRWGVTGAAAATAMSEIVGGMIPFIYFLRKNTSTLRLVRPKWNGKAVIKSATNGASEMLTNLSMSLVSVLYNFQLIKIAGADGVAAYGVIMYVTFIFSGIFIGYSIGSAPLISFNYGARNSQELKNLFKKSLILIGLASLVLVLIAEFLATPLARIFVGYDLELLIITSRALKLFSLSFLFSGINMFASSFFTALSNGFVSALISILRTLVFQVIMIFLLPLLFGLDGIWLAVVIAELLTLFFTVFAFLVTKRYYRFM
ncbi:Multidrug export protein MepA [Jeotgalibaca dankookensis]|uniref:Multidrug export protein MepA n=1 Tax=Jeotgalibaca dankookensis TaxID=708126 RepID=A0A1S6IRU3_9LACT|nr:MATE family efflux transporter [Jeotgalibaca dankookensis]AQS54271.1 Multidrug export protein MepA [Jeotgalibaca dankookensis]